MRSFLYRNALDLWLLLLGVASICLMFKSSTDSTGNQIIFDVAVGIVVSLFVYVLVVRLPEYQKKRRVKVYLLRRYDNLKHDCITHFLLACEERPTSDLIDELKEVEKFKNYFKIKVASNQNRWYAVLNGLTDESVTAIVRELDMFRGELDYALTSVDVTDKKVFTFMRNFTQVLQGSRYWSDREDQLKPLSKFMWSAFAGWDFITGYTGKDSIAEMIDSI